MKNQSKKIMSAMAGAVLMLAVVFLASCGNKENQSNGKSLSPKAPVSLNGAGASFPFPVYSQWIYQYQQASGIKVNYQSIGSGGGIAQIKAKTVDFGASDAPLKKKELDSAGLVQFPMIMGGVVVVTNLDGIPAGKLRLSRKNLTDILLGKIRKWNDPALTSDNPGLLLPNREITFVHRSDGSGTTWIFTNYIDKISKEWHEKVGTGKAVKWPVGIGGKGNEGVAAYVQRVKGSIGYVEIAYALQNKLSYALLENRAGKYVAPSMSAFQEAATNADWQHAPGFYMVLTDQPGDASWPITGASFILVHKEQADPSRAQAMFQYFRWCYENGGKTAENLHYVPVPENVVSLVEDMWRKEVRCSGKPVWE